MKSREKYPRRITLKSSTIPEKRTLETLKRTVLSRSWKQYFVIASNSKGVNVLHVGFRDCCFAAGTEVRGGQTARNPWVLLGGCATSVLPRDQFVMPNAAVAGDVLVCTKPLGTQVSVNLHQWMDQGDSDGRLKGVTMSADAIEKGYQDATLSMMTLNKTASRLMTQHSAHAATDITGFGILGHADNLAQAQKAKTKMIIDRLPVLKSMARADKELGHMFQLRAGRSAETSGGLLIAMPAQNASAFIADLKVSH